MPGSRAHYAEGPEVLVVSLTKKGDRIAFEELVRRRQSWIRNLMRRFGGDAALADDLSQQVFMQAWRKIRQLNDVNKFAGWIKQMAINEWLQYVRKNDPLRYSVDDREVAMSKCDSTSIAMDLDLALATLPLAVSTCVVLSYHERMTHDEIAKITGIKIGTVKSHIRRGTARLRTVLSSYDESANEVSK